MFASFVSLAVAALSSYSSWYEDGTPPEQQRCKKPKDVRARRRR